MRWMKPPAQLTKNQIEGILQLSEATAQLADAKNQLARDRASWMRQRIAQRNLRI